jgi:hypothetical protein
MDQRAAIEAEFGEPLDWNEKDNARQCRVVKEVEGGYRSAEADWPALRQTLIDHMERLDRALRSRVAKLP